MTVGKLADSGLFEPLNTGDSNACISKPFSCDLLSLALTKDLNGCAWFTVIGNVNTVAVAVHTGASCVVLCEGVRPDDEALSKAKEHNVSIFTTDLPVFDAALKLSALTGVK